MKVSEILKEDKVTISCEIFPPKKGSQLENYKGIVAEMAALKPSYISCTYGATGTLSRWHQNRRVTLSALDTASRGWRKGEFALRTR